MRRPEFEIAGPVKMKLFSNDCLRISKQVNYVTRVAHLHHINLNLLIFLKYTARSMIYFVLSICSSERKDWRKLISWSVLACAAIAGPLGGTFPEINYVLSMSFTTLELAGIASALALLVTFILDVIRRKEKLLSCKAVRILVSTVGSVLFLGMMNEGTPLIAIQSGLDLAPSPMPSTSTWSGVLFALLVCFASSTAITAYFTTLHQENMCPDLAYTFALGGLMDLFGALTAETCFRFRFNDLQLNTKMSVAVVCSVLVSVVATVELKWCEQQKGTSYVAAFSSLPLIIDSIAAPLALTGQLHWGSVASCISMVIAICPSIRTKAKEAADADAAAPNDYCNNRSFGFCLSPIQSDLAPPHPVLYKLNLLRGIPSHPQGIPCCQDDSNSNLRGQEKDSPEHLESEQLQGDSIAIPVEIASSTTSNDQGIEMGDIVQTVIDVDGEAPAHSDDTGEGIDDEADDNHHDHGTEGNEDQETEIMDDDDDGDDQLGNKAQSLEGSAV